MIFIYRTLLFLLDPFIRIYLLKRKIAGKEDKERFRERLGFSSAARPEGKVLWFHAASIGESMSVLTLIGKISKEFKDANILVTTGTKTSAAIMRQRLQPKAIHQYIPVDKTSAVKRFISYWKPDVSFWVESELWPNLVYESSKSGTKMFLINARISDESYKKWLMFKTLSHFIISKFTLCLAQSERDREKFLTLGAKNVNFVGNLKYDAGALYADPKELSHLSHMIGERQVFLAASTHEGEEDIILATHKMLRSSENSLLTIIVPRHPHRGSDVASIAKKHHLQFAMRSNKDSINQSTEVYIADTVGELGIFYRLASTVFMGGSLINHGGQNPLEAARLDSAIISGPYNHNFSDIYENLERNNAAIIVANNSEMINSLKTVILSKEKRKEMSANALEFVKNNVGTADRFVEEIKKNINQNA